MPWILYIPIHQFLQTHTLIWTFSSTQQGKCRKFNTSPYFLSKAQSPFPYSRENKTPSLVMIIDNEKFKKDWDIRVDYQHPVAVYTDVSTFNLLFLCVILQLDRMLIHKLTFKVIYFFKQHCWYFYSRSLIFHTKLEHCHQKSVNRIWIS